MTENISKDKSTGTFKLKKPEPDFLPYACLFDHSTILTKNGELLQTLRIAGLTKISEISKIDLRGIIRKAIRENIDSKNYAIWIHTVRSKVDLDDHPYFESSFAHDTHEIWCKKNYWRDKFVNELYVTIIHIGEPLSLNEKNLSSFISPKYVRSSHLKKLENAKIELYSVVDGMLKTLNSYGAIRLTNKLDRHGVHSENLEFLSKLIHLEQKRQEVPIKDLSEYLAVGKMAFGDKSFQITEGDSKIFGAILTIKDYQDFDVKLIDKLLHLPQEFIITQTLDFIDAIDAKKNYEYADYILRISKDEWLHNCSGIKQIMESDSGIATDYASSQLTVMIIGKDQSDLQLQVENSVRQMKKIGLVVVREDLNMELCFWSQLPGNFNYIRRNVPINTNRVGGLASLHNSPKGRQESKWGMATTIFRLKDSTPYFFNFHSGEIGHSFICGPQKSGKSTLTNFLLSEASKFKPNILYIDQFDRSRIIIKALGGKHNILDYKAQKYNHKFNPFSLKDNKENHLFLKFWLKCLIYSDSYTLNEKEDSAITKAISKVYSLDPKKRRLKYASEFFYDKGVVEKFLPWIEGGEYASLFDNETDDFDLSVMVRGYDLSKIDLKDDKLNALLMTYFFRRFSESLTGKPSILLVNDAQNLLRSQFFTNSLDTSLKYFSSKNAIVIFMIDANEINGKKFNIGSPQNFSTQLFMPDPELSDNYKLNLQLSDEEIKIIKEMKILNRHFLIKKQEEVNVAELNLDGLIYALSALSGKKEYIEIMEESIKDSSENPNDWLSLYYKKVKTYQDNLKNTLF